MRKLAGAGEHDLGDLLRRLSEVKFNDLLVGSRILLSGSERSSASAMLSFCQDGLTSELLSVDIVRRD